MAFPSVKSMQSSAEKSRKDLKWSVKKQGEQNKKKRAMERAK